MAYDFADNSEGDAGGPSTEQKNIFLTPNPNRDVRKEQLTFTVRI